MSPVTRPAWLQTRWFVLPLLSPLLLASVAGMVAGIHGCGVPLSSDLPVTATNRVTAGCPVRVYLIRGLWDIFSLGLNDLAEKLQSVGLEADARSGPDTPNLLQDILRSYAEGSGGQASGAPLVLVGHSYGSDDAIMIARQLKSYGVSIALLVLIDATNPTPIPDNVDRCLHLYLPSGLGVALPEVFSGNPVVAEAGNHHTVIVNLVVSVENFGRGVEGIDHFNIEESSALHAYVRDQILELCPASADEGSTDAESP